MATSSGAKDEHGFVNDQPFVFEKKTLPCIGTFSFNVFRKCRKSVHPEL